jgi:hypothetical protein
MTANSDRFREAPISCRFSSAEDVMVIRAVAVHGPCNWSAIASLVPGRSGRQCRDRYQNYLRPDHIRAEWTETEDELLAAKFEELGSQWALMTHFFSGRSSNSLKNRMSYLRGKKKAIRIRSRRLRAPSPLRKETLGDAVDDAHPLECQEDTEIFDLFTRERYGGWSEMYL